MAAVLVVVSAKTIAHLRTRKLKVIPESRVVHANKGGATKASYPMIHVVREHMAPMTPMAFAEVMILHVVFGKQAPATIANPMPNVAPRRMRVVVS